MLNWANRFNICCFLDNHQYQSPNHSLECILAAGSLRQLQANAGNAFAQLQNFYIHEKDWLFGHFSYDLKNEIENLSSSNPDFIQFPDLFFFVPEIVLKLSATHLSIGMFGVEHDRVYKEIQKNSFEIPGNKISKPFTIYSRIKKEDYIDTINQLKGHILRGDCYEINYCQEFFSEEAGIDPLQTYLSLSEISPNPFSAYYKVINKYCLCASPERYLKKEGNRLISQPIKGTWRRNIGDPLVDEQNRQLLYQSEKDRAENVMVVDLVRNDLSKICEEGSVKVEELFGIYSFPNVHQMISTIEGQIRRDVSWVDAIKASFPMGSMTGAPKKKVLELIEQYEQSRRGLFSGALGYITPEGDFDFNVVIRSILYNSQSNYLSYHTGSAITFQSIPEDEYEECLLKGSAIKKVLAF